MKKVLIAFDRTNFSKGAFEFARQMNEREHLLLTGLFLPEVVIPTINSYASAMGDSLLIPLVEDEDELMNKNIQEFESLCLKNNIEYRTRKEFTDFAIPELKKETLFADVVIIGSQAFYEDLHSNKLNESLKEALHISKCPVVVVPEAVKLPKTNVLTYDGTDNSVFAIKQFSYLFPSLSHNKTFLIYLKNEKGYELPFEEYIEELAGRHFTNLTIAWLHQDQHAALKNWLKDKEQPILVSGAFHRSQLSQLLKKSFVSDFICEHQLPIFIAHSTLS
jgi:hypothetical protein